MGVARVNAINADKRNRLTEALVKLAVHLPVRLADGPAAMQGLAVVKDECLW
jgi:hypothetical protein